MCDEETFRSTLLGRIARIEASVLTLLALHELQEPENVKAMHDAALEQVKGEINHMLTHNGYPPGQPLPDQREPWPQIIE